MNSYLSFHFGDVRWRVRADAAELLFDAAGLRLPSWLKSGQASVVKQGPHRTVYRVQLGGRTVYVKHYRVADARAMLSQWAQSSKARREWERAEYAAGRSIPTTVPLALGEQRKAGLVFENYLVTDGIEDVEPLDSFVQNTFPKLPTELQSRVRRQVANGLAELVARLHDAGVLHPDLHSGNVLVRFRTPENIEFFLIDLQEAKAARRASWRRSRKNLLAFGLFFLTAARRLDRARFLRRYLEIRSHLGLDWQEHAAKLERDLQRKALNFWRRLDGRCVSINRRFSYRNIGSAHGFRVAELEESTLLSLLRDPDAPLRTGSAEMLKESPSSAVARLTMRLGGSDGSVVYKRFNCPKWLDPIRAMLHHSPALRAWRAGHGLLIRRIPTPRPLALIERTRGPLVRENYLVTQAIPDSLSLRFYLKQVVATLPANLQRRRVRWLMRRIGELVRWMHNSNISHRDMKAANFLVTPVQAASESPAVYLIDLAGVQMWRTLPDFRRLQNLARIVVSLESYSVLTRTDILRFLRAYWPSRNRDRAEWKSLYGRLRLLTAEKVARNRQQGRPIT